MTPIPSLLLTLSAAWAAQTAPAPALDSAFSGARAHVEGLRQARLANWSRELTSLAAATGELRDEAKALQARVEELRRLSRDERRFNPPPYPYPCDPRDPRCRRPYPCDPRDPRCGRYPYPYPRPGPSPALRRKASELADDAAELARAAADAQGRAMVAAQGAPADRTLEQPARALLAAAQGLAPEASRLLAAAKSARWDLEDAGLGEEAGRLLEKASDAERDAENERSWAEDLLARITGN